MNAVAISPRWLLTAWHIARDVGTNSYVNDDHFRYRVTRAIDLGNDLAMIEVDRPLPFFSRLSKSPGRVGEIMQLYGQSGVPHEPILDKDLVVRGWKFGVVSNETRLRWGKGRRFEAPLSTIQWDFNNHDAALGQGGLNCAAVNTNDSGGGIFVGEDLIGVVTGFLASGYRLDDSAAPAPADCANPKGHIFDSSTLYQCRLSARPFTRGTGAPVYPVLSNIYAIIAPPRFLNVGGPEIVDHGRIWESTLPCPSCSSLLDASPDPIDVSTVLHPAPQAVYRSAVALRAQPGVAMQFNIDGCLKYERYEVRLHFAGLLPADAPAVCQERITVNRQEKVFDPFTGPRRASVLTFDAIAPDENGAIGISIQPENPAGNALLAGIEVTLARFSIPAYTEWKSAIAGAGNDAFASMAFGNNVFVASGGGLLTYSSDQGLTWQPAAEVGLTAAGGVLFAAGSFVTPVGNAILSSTNGRDWAVHPIPNGTFNRVVYGNGLFVASGNNSIAVSPDGSTWNLLTNRLGSISPINFANGIFSALTTDNKNAWVSSNGTAWVKSPITLPPVDAACVTNCPTFRSLSGAFFIGDRYFAYAFEGAEGLKVLTATDPRVWTVNTNLDSTSLVHVNNLWIDYYHNRISVDLANWTSIDPPIPFIGFFGGGLYFSSGGAAGSGFLRGTSITNMTSVTQPGSPWARPRPALDHNRLVIVSPLPGLPIPLLASVDGGKTFAPASFPESVSSLRGVASGQGQFVAVGDRGMILRSTDALNWVRVPSDSGDDLVDVTFSGSLWLALGAHGSVLLSTNAFDFSSSTLGTDAEPTRIIATRDDHFLAIGTGGLLFRSSDATHWTNTKISDSQPTGVAFGNGRTVAVDSHGRSFVSTDGTDWTSVQLDATNLVDIAYAGGLFLTFAANAPYGFASPDGLNWTSTTLPSGSLNLDSVAGEFWINALNGTRAIWKSNLGVPAPTLQAWREGDGTLHLSFDAVVSGVYRVLSAESLSSPAWQAETELRAESAAQLNWSTEGPARSSRFYRVQRE